MSQNSSTSSSPEASSSPRGKRQRHSNSRPPPRLSWPAGVGNVKSSAGGALKRPRLFSSQQSKSSSSTNNNGSKDQKGQQGLWIDKYPPTTSSELCVAPKKVKEVGVWLDEATATPSFRSNKKLLILVGTPGIGKSTTVRVLCDEKKLSLLYWNESFVPRAYNEGSSEFSGVQQSSAMDSFHEFLQQSSVGLHSLDFIFHVKNNNASPMTSSSSSTNNPSVILLENLPNLHGPDMEFNFRQIMEEHLSKAQTPTILIFSDVSEGKHRPKDLERLIDPKILYSDAVTIMQIHSVTKAKMKKVVGNISKKQGHGELTKEMIEELHLQSNGDIRHAIMNLQLQSAGLKSLASKASSGSNNNDRDIKLSTFHALGKLLYAKRKEIEDDDNDFGGKPRSMLAFDPEAILERSDLGVGGSLSFLEYHSMDFFTDITDISNAFELFSDAATLLEPTQARQGPLSSFHETCASSVAGRAVANTNTKPTPNKFRQFSTPKVFDVLKNRSQNRILFDQLSLQLSSCHLSLPSVLTCNQTMVTELLPSMRVIIPDEVDPVVDNLYSIARANANAVKIKSNYQREQAILKEQAAILEVDDIEDFDSSDEEEAKSHSNSKSDQNNLTSSQDAPPIVPRASQPAQRKVEDANVLQDTKPRDSETEIIVIDN